ncbi:transcription initiation protein SPT3 [Nematocida sp. AWRm77]|nr:transcription initiation protein SPT3 [Nematocida sp. AWRm77]
MSYNRSNRIKIECGTLSKCGEKEALGYQHEIKAMMYACGDVRVPEKDSSLYLEQIVHVQMKMILEKAYEISKIRGSKIVSIEDVIFVLRKNPSRIKKLSNYIMFKDIRNKVNKDVVKLDTSHSVKLKYSWLPADIYTREDDLKDRLLAVDKITENMTKEEYLDFTECRQASFTFRKVRKFKEFLNSDYKVKEDTVDILGFVACEVVFDIVSLAAELASKKVQQARSKEEGFGMFKAKTNKLPISILDIEEACRKLKNQKVLF